MIADRCVSKCRVRTAHAALTATEMAVLVSHDRDIGAVCWRPIKRVRGAHPTTPRIPSRGPMALAQGHPGPAPHSRDGGNPASFANDTGSPPSRGRRIKGRWNIEDYFLVDAQWIPVPKGHAGMTAWPRATIGIGQIILPMGMPVEAISMRLSRHAAPGRGGLGPAKRDTASGKATKKCRVDQAWHKDKCCQGLASGHQNRIHRPSIPEASMHDTLIDPTVFTAKRRNRCATLNEWASAVPGSEILGPESTPHPANRFRFALTP